MTAQSFIDLGTQPNQPLEAPMLSRLGRSL
jgi:hypothetical protein